MKTLLYSFVVVVALFLTGCADAGKNQTVSAGVLVTLDASASSPSSGGEIERYRWKQMRGEHVTLSDERAIKPTFTAPETIKKSTLVFRLTTVEVGGHPYRLRSHDFVYITVLPKEDNTTDDIAPVITLNGSAALTLEQGETYTEEGATATDNVDGAVEVTISGEVDMQNVGTYIITYTATDAAGNIATKDRTITVIMPADTEAPVITLNGDANMSLMQGEIYTEPGAAVVDNRDTNISVVISGTVDTNTPGIYTITYTATDYSNNTATAERVVAVVENNETNGSIINVSNAMGVEGQILIHTVTLERANNVSFSYDFSIEDNTTTAGEDYNTTPTFTSGVTYDKSTQKVTVPAGVGNFEIHIQTFQDGNNYEDFERYSIYLNNHSAIGIIGWEAPGPNYIESVSDASGIEGDVLVHQVHTVHMGGPADSFYFKIEDNTTTAGEDYNTTVTFTNGVTYDDSAERISLPLGVVDFEVHVQILNDDIAETDETYTVTTRRVSATGTIYDLDDNNDTNRTAVESISNNVSLEEGNAIYNVALESSVPIETRYPVEIYNRIDNKEESTVYITVFPGEDSFVLELPYAIDNIGDANKEPFLITIDGVSNNPEDNNETNVTADIQSVSVSGEESNYTFAVTLKSSDINCTQYADWWEVLSEDGALIYRRVLRHSHANEQPFTRSGGAVDIQKDQTVYIRAHMNTTGYAGNVFVGTVESQFTLADNPPSFSDTIEQLQPLPTGCDF